MYNFDFKNHELRTKVEIINNEYLEAKKKVVQKATLNVIVEEKESYEEKLHKYTLQKRNLFKLLDKQEHLLIEEYKL